jgi:hypothetical protein
LPLLPQKIRRPRESVPATACGARVLYRPAVSGPSLKLRLVAQLDVSAASGIACVAEHLYVLADDLLELAVYDLHGARKQSIRLLPGELPSDHAARKAHKPDFEALLELPDGSLLALGSGSTERRQRGAWVQALAAEPRSSAVDLSGLYAALMRELPELNVEGGVVLGAQLYLASRGNGVRRENALVQLDLGRVLASLQSERCLRADSIVNIERVQLPELDSVPLSITDLAVADGGLIFAAAAEASANTYDDGACAGSVVGRLATDGTTRELVMVARGIKLEGICCVSARELFAVADADDPHAQAPLFAFEPWH